MSVSMYRLTVPVFQRGLKTLAAYLDKAEAYANRFQHLGERKTGA